MSNKNLEKELKAMRKDLDYIKEHMIDIDTILTPAEKEALDEADKEYREGKTISLEKLRKELGLKNVERWVFKKGCWFS